MHKINKEEELANFSPPRIFVCSCQRAKDGGGELPDGHVINIYLCSSQAGR